MTSISLANDPVAPDSLVGIPRQRTNPKRWVGDNWSSFVDALRDKQIDVRCSASTCGIYVTDAGGLGQGMPEGVVIAQSSEDVAEIMKAAQTFEVPVTTRGGGLTTEGESIAYGGLMLDMTGMSRVLEVDPEAMTVRAEAGIFWHTLAEVLRRQGLDYLSAPLNLTASVGGTLGVGGIDVNSPRLGCSADQTLALKVVTPTGDIVECSADNNPELFDRVLLGYGQFGVITEATLKVRTFTPCTMVYYYYDSLKVAIEDMRVLVEGDAADYCGILTIMDRSINLLVAFDSDERQKNFEAKWKPTLRGRGELAFALRMAFYYLLRPWRFKEAFYLLSRRLKLLPEFSRPEYMDHGKLVDRSVVFSRAVWKFWGGKTVVIPDLSTSADKFVQAVERGNAVCKKYFKYYTLYCVGIRLFEHGDRYELSCIPPDAHEFAYGCEFEPMLRGTSLSRDRLQAFKNDIYDIGLDMGASYYRFGGHMKGYVRRAFGDALVDKHLAMKKQADPAMILNRDVIF